MIISEYYRWEKDGGRELQYTFKDIGSESIVFDVGMYKGLWSNKISSRYNPYIFGFEPIVLFYSEAEQKFKSNSKIKIYNYGLGDSNRQDTIGVDEDSSSLSIEGPCVEHITIKDIFEITTSLRLEKINLLALNCEGSEYEILQRLLTTNTINRFEKLFIQFHFIRNGDQILRENIVHELAKTHVQNYCYLSVWELWTKK